MGNTYYIGWDVGALYCQKKKLKNGQFSSHDALCLQCPDGTIQDYDQPICRDLIYKEESIVGFCNELFDKEFDTKSRFFIAIDAVFKWPSDFVTQNFSKINFPDDAVKAIENRWMFRDTERFVKEKTNIQPFSVVQDKIGSQSIKTIIFLKKHGFAENKDMPGIWLDANRNVAIETYPTVVNVCKGKNDLHDARICLELVRLFARGYNENTQQYTGKELFAPTSNSITDGWIWFPKKKLTIQEYPCPTQSKTN